MISEVASKMRAMGFLGVNLLNSFCGERGGGHVKVEIRVKAPLKRHPDSTVQSLVTIVE